MIEEKFVRINENTIKVNTGGIITKHPEHIVIDGISGCHIGGLKSPYILQNCSGILNIEHSKHKITIIGCSSNIMLNDCSEVEIRNSSGQLIITNIAKIEILDSVFQITATNSPNIKISSTPYTFGGKALERGYKIKICNSVNSSFYCPTEMLEIVDSNNLNINECMSALNMKNCKKINIKYFTLLITKLLTRNDYN